MSKKQRKCLYQLKTKARFELNTLKSTLFLLFLTFFMNKTFLYLLFLESSVSERWETPQSVTNPLYTWNPDPSLEQSTLGILLACVCEVKMIIGFPQYIFSACELVCSLATLPVCLNQNILRSNLVENN